jgi:hypothetical protein
MADKHEGNGAQAGTRLIAEKLGGPLGHLDRDDRGVFAIRHPSAEANPIAAYALDRLEHAEPIAAAREAVPIAVRERGISDEVQKLTLRLNRAGLSENDRLLLSTPGVYEYLIGVALDEEQVDPADTTGFYETVIRHFEEPKRLLVESIVKRVLATNSIDLRPKPNEYARLLDVAQKSGISLTSQALEMRILDLQRQVSRERNLPELVELFAEKNEIPRAKFTDAVKQAMVRYLQDLDLKAKQVDIAKGTYDEYFAVAYDRALATAGRDGRSDPILLTRADASVVDWDGSVMFPPRSDELAGFVPANIKIAGAVKYLYDYDHLMGVFNVTKAIILRWASGALEIVDPGLQNNAYRYYKLLSDGSRISEEETEMVYRTVLGFGDAQLLSRMTANESFQPLWDNLMSAVAQYISDSRDAAKDSIVSRNPIFQAVEELQANLSTAVSGMVRKQAAEIKGKFDDALAILGHPEIAASTIPGPQKTFLKVVERISRDEFGTAPEVYSIRTMAEEGYKVLNFVASFDRAGVRDDDFENFKESAEAWIIAAATVTDSSSSSSAGRSPAAVTNGGADFKTDDLNADAW